MLASQRFNIKTVDDLYAAIGSGNARLQQVINHLQYHEERNKPPIELDPQSLVKPQQTQQKFKADANGITVSGVGNLLTHMAKCCHPVPGDDIGGFITQGRGISVHRNDCDQFANALNQQPERQVEVQWVEQSQQNYLATVKVIASDRQGLVRDISTIVSNERVSIVGMESRSDASKQTVAMLLNIEIPNNEILGRLIGKLLQLDDVLEVKRL
jgi:GTP pyrophosphokinase